ncbi:hypothetical protein N9459_04310 [Flavobacteriaceae bacterium]|nr:hypothetical protein [Flavobacteriaceae bacterium]
MIGLLAKQIELNGDREVILCINSGETYIGVFEDFHAIPMSATKASDSTYIEIYGE